jgi:hypothetical protein
VSGGADRGDWLSSPQNERIALTALLVVAGCTYAATAARHILGGDNAELATLFHVGGVAHPSGYPLTVLYLRAMRWLPAASPAHGAALATSLLAVLGLYTAYRACRAVGASPLSALTVTSVHAFSLRAWIVATHAEVFAMNATIAAAIVWIATDDRVGGARRVVILALLAGLGLSNHHTIVLLAPIGIYGVARGIRESGKRAIAPAIAGFAAGLLPYAYVLYVGRHPSGHFVWGEVDTLRGVLFHFRRGEYGTVSLAVQSHGADRLGQLSLLARNIVLGLLLLPLLALICTRGRPRVQTLCLAASAVLAGPVLVSLFNLTTVGLDRVIVERFHLLAQVLTALLIAPALDRIPLKFVRRACLALIPLAALIAYPDVREHNRADVELYVRNTLAAAPRDAVMIGSGDHRFAGFLYAREALGLRTDVVYLDAWLLLNPWYRRRMSAILGFEVTAPANRSLSTIELVAQLHATGRPVLVANAVSGAIGATYPSYPIGTLRRVLPIGTAVPPPDVVQAWNQEVFAQMTFLRPPPEIGTWGGDLQRSYVEPWQALAQAWDRAGHKDRADFCRQRAAELSPYGD